MNRTLQYRKCRGLIRWILRSQRLGAIGHISCVDLRPDARTDPGGPGEERQLRHVGASQLIEICEMFDSAPAAVMARLTQTDDGGSRTEAFLEMQGGTHVHYSGMLGDDAGSHILWIEGTKGSLRTDGRGIWWRKRGWPLFVPIVPRWLRPGSPHPAGSEPRVDELVEAAVESSREGRQVGLPQRAPEAASA